MAELLFPVFLLPFHTIYIVLGGLLVRTTGRLTEWGSLSWARTTKAGMNGRRALGEWAGAVLLVPGEGPPHRASGLLPGCCGLLSDTACKISS